LAAPSIQGKAVEFCGPRGIFALLFAEAIDSQIRSVELERRIFRFPLVEELQMEQSTSILPNWTLCRFLEKWTRLFSMHGSTFRGNLLGRNFKVLLSFHSQTQRSLKNQRPLGKEAVKD
jgi:hypothetical protein